MTTAERFLALLATGVTGLGATLRVLWNISKAWTATNYQLQGLIRQVGALIEDNEREHERMNYRINRHEEIWHGKHRRIP